jgi:pilus assembly protein FimV
MAEPAAARTVESTVQTTLPPEQTTRKFMAVSTPEPSATMPAMVDEGAPDASDPYADILGEADIHIAYGLYDEAARLLQEPLAKSPDRKDLHLKLLEVYFSANMPREFEAQAGKMRQAVSGTNDPDWEKVCIMGRQLCPDSALFTGGGGGTGIAPTADLDFTSMLAGAQGAAAAAPTPAPPPQPAPAAGSGAAGSLDLDLSGFNLGVGADTKTAPATPSATAKAPEAPAPAAADAGNTLDFNLEDFKFDAPTQAAAATAGTAPEQKDSGLDIDLTDFDMGAPDSTATPEAAKTTVDDIGGEVGIDDLLTPELESGAGQADTRLDLARAYMDMGEPAMAQSLLQEVIAQGNAAQKQEAKELLGRLGSV